MQYSTCANSTFCIYNYGTFRILNMQQDADQNLHLYGLQRLLSFFWSYKKKSSSKSDLNGTHPNQFSLVIQRRPGDIGLVQGKLYKIIT